jgi:hypothetical protein
VERQSCIPDVGGADAWQTDVNRHGLHVQAVASYPVTMSPQKLIAPGRAVSAYHVDFGVGLAQLSVEIVQQIKNLGVVVADVAGTVITQVAIKLIECAGNVMVAFAINDIEVFAGVQVKKF